MKLVYTRGTIGAALCALVALPAFAQHEGHQAPGVAAAAAPAASVSSCAQGSQGVTRSIDMISARIEQARQTNEAPTMRAAVADLQVALAQMKSQLADCTALAEGGGSMAGMDHSKMQMAPGTPAMQPGSPSPAPAVAGQMAGMDHSKMQMPAKAGTASGSGAPAAGAKAAAPAAGMDHSKMAAAPAAKTRAAEPSNMAGMDHVKMGGDKAAPSNAAQTPSVVFALRTQPAPPRSGKNDFEVTLKDAAGRPVADAEVSLAFYMPAMPAMNMAEMRSTVTLPSAGNGVYKASGTLGMAGDWDVTITAVRKGRTLGTNKVRLTAK